jgi:imidazolonepropionase-like amidohydrolase
MEGNTRKKLAINHILVPEDQKPPATPTDDPIGLTLPRAIPTDTFALTHARIITMEGGEVLEDATLIVQNDRILGINTPIPEGTRLIDASKSTIIPGLIDVHAHLHYTAGDILPEQEWRYQTALDFGVTTVHDPSAATDLVFTQGEAVEAGFMVGPRVYSTGYVLYGALSNQGAETPTLESAFEHVRRMKRVGAVSVKVYQQSQRERRQWYAKACREEQLMCVAEGGGDLWQNLTMAVDGFHAVEHTLPGPDLYADVRGLFAGSPTKTTAGTANTPTLLVAYNGLMAENWFFQHMSPLNNERLLRHFPQRELDRRAWRPTVMAQDTDWYAARAATSAAENLRAGALITLGAHGQLQGLGVHWELWTLAGILGQPAMTPMEALQTATINGARYLGMEDNLGSIKAGKLADFVVLNSDPSEDITHSTDIRFTVKNGVIYP